MCKISTTYIHVYCACRDLLTLSTLISTAAPLSLTSVPLFFLTLLVLSFPLSSFLSLPPSILPSLHVLLYLPLFPLLSSLSLFLLSCLPHPSLFSSPPSPPLLCLSPSHFLNRSPGGNRHSVHLPVTPPPHHPPLASSLSYVPNSPNQQHPPLHPSLSAVPSTRPGTSLIRVFLPEDQRTTVRFVLAQTEYKE